MAAQQYHRNVQRLRNIQRNQEYTDPRDGLTSRLDSNGDYETNPSQDLPPGDIWVRLNGNREASRCRIGSGMAGFELIPNYPVTTGINRAGEREAYKPSSLDPATRQTQSINARNGTIPGYLKSSQFTPGLVHAWVEGGYGLFVYVEPFPYKGKVVKGVVDVSSGVPGSSGQRGLTVIAYDASDDALVAVVDTPGGLPRSQYDPLNGTNGLEAAVAVDLGDTDRIRLGAVLLEYAQTSVTESDIFIDCRDWLTLGTGTAAEVSYDNAVSGLGSDNVQDAIDEVAAALSGATVTSVMPQGWLIGYEVDYDGTNLTLQPGQARSDSDDYNLTKTSMITINPATTGANGLDTGSLANSTWYYAFVIAKSSDGTIAGLLSTSATAPTMPSGYDQKRRVGCVRTDGSAALFRQKTTRGGGNLRLVQYREDTTSTTFRILNGVNLATFSSWTDVDCSPLVPPTSREIQGYALTAANVTSTIRWREASLSAQVIEIMRLVSSAGFGILVDHLPVNSSQHGELSNANNVSESFIFILNGYYDNLTPTIV